jgi:hypothetical protein
MITTNDPIKSMNRRRMEDLKGIMITLTTGANTRSVLRTYQQTPRKSATLGAMMLIAKRRPRLVGQKFSIVK